jgi:hypothetical protein
MFSERREEMSGILVRSEKDQSSDITIQYTPVG